jgi:hypothetical protein
MPQEIIKKKEKNPYLPTHFENFIKQENTQSIFFGLILHSSKE